jgi:hypothetical protein
MNNYFDDFILPPCYITQSPLLLIDPRELIIIILPRHDSAKKSAAKLFAAFKNSVHSPLWDPFYHLSFDEK